MKIAIIIFIVISSIFAIATLVYVAVDIILERRKKEEGAQTEPTQESEPEIIESAPVIIPDDMPVPVSAETGIEVIDVAWPESMAKNKIYKYVPNGEIVSRGDIVLVPTFDRHRHREILRTATVINGNYRVDSIQTDESLKKIVCVVK